MGSLFGLGIFLELVFVCKVLRVLDGCNCQPLFHFRKPFVGDLCGGFLRGLMGV